MKKEKKQDVEPCELRHYTVLRLDRSDVIGLAECPANIAGPILHNFVRWFCGLPSAPLKEPLANAIFTGLQARQNSIFEQHRLRRLETLEMERAVREEYNMEIKNENRPPDDA